MSLAQHDRLRVFALYRKRFLSSFNTPTNIDSDRPATLFSLFLSIQHPHSDIDRPARLFFFYFSTFNTPTLSPQAMQF